MKLIFAALLLFANVAFGQEFDTLQGVTITAVRGTTTQPLTETSLDIWKIEKENHGQEIPFLLAKTPSVTVTSDAGSESGYTYMRLRGLDQTRINVTLNGVPLNEPEDQGVYFSNFPDFISNIKSVQVQRGVGSSSPGTAAYAGSVNFESGISRNELVFRAPGALSLGLSRLDKHSYSIRHTQQYVPGYRDNSANESYSTFATILGLQGQNLYKAVAFSGLSKNQMAYLPAPLSEILKNPKYNQLGSDERDNFKQNFISGEWDRQITPEISTALTGYWNTLQGKNTVRLSPTDLPEFNLESGWVGVIGNLLYASNRWVSTLSAHANKYERVHFVQDQYRNAGYKNEQSVTWKSEYRIFPSRLTRLPLPLQIGLVSDIQLRSTNFKYSPSSNSGISSESIRWNFINPKIGIAAYRSIVSKFYLTYGQNTREPTRTDMFAGFDNLNTSNKEFVGDFNRVRTEKVRDLELGWEYKHLTLVLYDMEFRNEITPIGQISYIGLPLRKNVPQSRRRGLEWILDGSLSDSWGLGVNGTVSRNRIREYRDDATGVTYHNVKPLLTPEFLANGYLTYRWVTLFERYVGESQLDNRGSEFKTSGYFLSDLQIELGVLNRVTFRINNLLNNRRAFTGGTDDGEQPYYFITPTRNLYFGLTLGF